MESMKAQFSLNLRRVAKIFSILQGFILAILFESTSYAQAAGSNLTLSLGDVDSPTAMVPAVKILIMLTILSVAPAIILLTTCFTRIVIVLGFIRQALGTQSMPPNQVVLGLSLFLTYFVMAPIWEKVYQDSYLPYQSQTINQDLAIEKAIGPIKSFMLLQTSESDLSLFMKIAELDKPKTQEDVPLRVLMPAFLVSELKTAFQIGFLIYIPFLVIDMVVSSVLMAMGMMMLPPTVISLPFKLVLFVLVDGWSLIIQQVVSSIKDVSGT